jgi:hypothetical protein
VSSIDRNYRQNSSFDAQDNSAHAVIPIAPVQAPLAEENLLSRFLEFLSKAGRRTSWTLKLPYLKNSPDAHALRASLRAVSLAYFAHTTQDKAAQLESYRHYGDSLVRQRYALANFPAPCSGDPDLPCTAEADMQVAKNALLATVILSYFELVSSKNQYGQQARSSGWINHSLAAEHIIVMKGPQCLGDDIFAQLFFTVRSHAVHRAAVLGHYTAFSEEIWLEAAAQHVPKQSYARTVYDRVTEWCLRLSRLHLNGAATLNNDRADPSNQTSPDVSDVIPAMLGELERRYETFMTRCRRVPTAEYPLIVYQHLPDIEAHTLAHFDAPPIIGPGCSIGMHILPPSTECMTAGMVAEGPANLADLHPKLQKQFAAMTTAYFHMAVILMQAYFPETATRYGRFSEDIGALTTLGENGAQRTLERWNVVHNARMILSAAKYLSSSDRSNGTVVNRMMLPFSAIWHFCGPSHTQFGDPYSEEVKMIRLQARHLFEQWCTRDGMPGLISVAFDYSPPPMYH